MKRVLFGAVLVLGMSHLAFAEESCVADTQFQCCKTTHVPCPSASLFKYTVGDKGYSCTYSTKGVFAIITETATGKVYNAQGLSKQVIYCFINSDSKPANMKKGKGAKAKNQPVPAKLITSVPQTKPVGKTKPAGSK